MRILTIFLLLAGMALQASGSAIRVTVQQLEQHLVTTQEKSDAQVAEELSDLELTERLTEVHRARLEAALPGPRARQELALLAEASSFLDLPAADVLSQPAPDRATQVSLLAQARNYVASTVLKLPNFFATRETTSFVSTSANTRINSVRTIAYVPFHQIDNSKVTVLYRDGHELAANGKKNYKGSVKDLRTRGEFGPILVVIVNDASKGDVTWGHWEQGIAGPEAVFDYAVPQTASHYQVTSPGLTQQDRYAPAYRGEIAINPADGSILRLTVVAELKPDDPMTSADLAVDYGQVEIGGINYICPLRSVALSKVRIVNREMDDAWDVERSSLGPPQTYLNEVLFTHYHLFRAEAQILTENSQGTGETPSAPVAGNEPAKAEATAPEIDVPGEASPAAIGTRFTIADLQQALVLAKTYGTPDAEVVQRIAKVELTERLSDTRLARMEAEQLSPQVRQALEELADESAFLDIPEAEIPAKPAPDQAAQSAWLALAADYVHKTIPKLPDLSATRKTTRLENAPAGKTPADELLHKVGSSSATLIYRGGNESVNQGKSLDGTRSAFRDRGEFGPLLNAVMEDTKKGAVAWSHWEQTAHELEAVFSYAIPAESSHFPLLASLDHVSLDDQGGSIGPHGAGPGGFSNPAYHGEIYLRPSDGSILRMTIVADLSQESSSISADYLVEYGAVDLGGAKFICPERSVAIYQIQMKDHGAPHEDGHGKGIPADAPQTYLDEVRFTKYRLLGARSESSTAGDAEAQPSSPQ